MSDALKCPRCGSWNTGTSLDYKIKKGLGYAGEFAIGLGAGYFLGEAGGALVEDVNLHDQVEKEYECSACGYKWTPSTRQVSYSSPRPKKNKVQSQTNNSYASRTSNQPITYVTNKHYTRQELLDIVAKCDGNFGGSRTFSELTVFAKNPKEIRIALQTFGISVPTRALDRDRIRRYGDLVNYILEHTQPGKSTNKTESSKQYTAKQPSASSKPSITTPQEEKLSILRECSGEYSATYDTQLTQGILRFLVPNLKDWYSISIPDKVIHRCKTFGELANYLVSGTVKSEEKPQNRIKEVSASDEQEYVEMYKEYVADGEISERDRKMLDKYRSRLGISEERARELEESCSKPQLTEDEQEYLEMFKEYAADGEISERDRKMLNKMRDRMGISEERAKEIESL